MHFIGKRKPELAYQEHLIPSGYLAKKKRHLCADSEQCIYSYSFACCVLFSSQTLASFSLL
jgi:hypothetical protein